MNVYFLHNGELQDTKTVCALSMEQVLDWLQSPECPPALAGYDLDFECWTHGTYADFTLNNR